MTIIHRKGGSIYCAACAQRWPCEFVTTVHPDEYERQREHNRQILADLRAAIHAKNETP